MKVSIITATFNSSGTIIDTLKSIESQTYQNIEYIIVDGASKDNTLDIIKKHCSRVTTIISEPDKGIYDALNKGIQASTGDIVGFLHSDDLFAYPNAVQDLVDTISLENTDAVYADLDYVSKENTNHIIRRWISNKYKRQHLKLGWMPPHPTFYMSRQKYLEYGLFDLKFKISADYDSLLRYLWKRNLSLAYCPKVIMKMRVGGESNRSIMNMIKKTKEDIQALQNNGLFWPIAIINKNLSKIPQFFKR